MKRGPNFIPNPKSPVEKSNLPLYTNSCCCTSSHLKKMQSVQLISSSWCPWCRVRAKQEMRSPSSDPNKNPSGHGQRDTGGTGGPVHVSSMAKQPPQRSLWGWECSLNGVRCNERQGSSNLRGSICSFGDTALICSIPSGASLLFSQQLRAS